MVQHLKITSYQWQSQLLTTLSCQNKHVIITNPVEHAYHCFKHLLPQIKRS